MLRRRPYKFYMFGLLLGASILTFSMSLIQFKTLFQYKTVVKNTSQESTTNYNQLPPPSLVVNPSIEGVYRQVEFTPHFAPENPSYVRKFPLMVNPTIFNYSYITPEDPSPQQIEAVDKERQEIEAIRCPNLKHYRVFNFQGWEKVTDRSLLKLTGVLSRWTVIPFVNEGLPVDKVNEKVTVVTQLTVDRLGTLLYLMNGENRWKGRVSATLFLEFSSQVDEYISLIKSHWPQSVLDRLDLHIVVAEMKYIMYPINFLRNVAWNFVKTDFVFLLDVDFIPSQHFMEKVPSYVWNSLDTGVAWVVVAFNSNCTYNQTIEMGAGTEIFGQIPAWTKQCGRGEPTLPNHPSQQANYIDHWFNATMPYQVPYRPYFEPYIIGPSAMPRYDETFHYGGDKLVHLYEVTAAGYKFVVLPEVYLEHLPHKPYSSAGKKLKLTPNPPKKICEVVNRVRCQYHFDSICTSEEIRKSTDESIINLRKHMKNTCGCGELYLPMK